MNNTGPQMYKFAAEHRSITCIHEAAHAVVLRLGAYVIHKVEVAPEGVSEWNTTRKDGSIVDDLWGYCSIYYYPKILKFAFELIHTDYQNQRFNCDKKLFSEKMLEVREAKAAEYMRMIRAYIMGTLAGLFAERIFDKDAKYPQQLSWPSDIDNAKAMCHLLPNHFEQEYLANETERVLREPDIWEKVLNLARSLELSGKIESRELFTYLPKPRPKWPHYPEGYKPGSATNSL